MSTCFSNPRNSFVLTVYDTQSHHQPHHWASFDRGPPSTLSSCMQYVVRPPRVCVFLPPLLTHMCLSNFESCLSRGEHSRHRQVCLLAMSQPCAIRWSQIERRIGGHVHVRRASIDLSMARWHCPYVQVLVLQARLCRRSVRHGGDRCRCLSFLGALRFANPLSHSLSSFKLVF
jgi:hypothetical protein